jgi:hypothetical protein
MPWVWVAVVLVLWAVVAFAVIALCMSVRAIDARLGRDRKGARTPKKAQPRPGTRTKVE